MHVPLLRCEEEANVAASPFEVSATNDDECLQFAFYRSQLFMEMAVLNVLQACLIRQRGKRGDSQIRFSKP